MANLLDIRRRIKSVKNTQQITKAMKMVSAAKLKRAQERAVSARPFATKMAEVLTGLASHAGEDFHHPLLDARGDERYLLVLVTADKGLAGAFNANIIKAAQAFINEHAGKSVEILAVGRKGRDFFRRRGAEIVGEPRVVGDGEHGGHGTRGQTGARGVERECGGEDTTAYRVDLQPGLAPGGRLHRQQHDVRRVHRDDPVRRRVIGADRVA